MQFARQTWALVKKDLIILLRRRWLSTVVRALIFPVVLTVILAYIKVWTATSGTYGVGTPSAIRSLSDALSETGSTRPKVVLINGGFADGDIAFVIDQLSATINNSDKELHLLIDSSELPTLCPSSNSGVSSCYGAVQFHSSPDHGGTNWNYTIFADSSIGSSISVTSNNNDLQLYTLPLQHAVDSAIASTHGGAGLPSTILQYPFTSETESEKERNDSKAWQLNVQFYLAFAFFIALCGLTYHLTGYVVQQREQGVLQLVYAMMPNHRHWECMLSQ